VHQVNNNVKPQQHKLNAIKKKKEPDLNLNNDIEEFSKNLVEKHSDYITNDIPDKLVIHQSEVDINKVQE